MLGRVRVGSKISLLPRLPQHIETIYGWYDDPSFFSHLEPPALDQFDERYEKRADDRDWTLWSIVPGHSSLGFAENLDQEDEADVIGITELTDFVGPGSSLSSFMYIIPSERGKDYGTEATRLRAGYAFEMLDLELLETTTETANLAAQKALENAGYRRTGVRPHAFQQNGKWQDLYYYALLREWWQGKTISS